MTSKQSCVVAVYATHVEAENAGVLPARFSVLPRALRVIVP